MTRRLIIATAVVMAVAAATAYAAVTPIPPDQYPRGCHPNGEALQGGVGFDDLVGTPERDLLRGGPNGDGIRGHGGKDCLFGQTGFDTIHGGRGDGARFMKKNSLAAPFG